MNDMYPQVLFPAFRMQANMMMYTLGNTFWLDKRHNLEMKRQDIIKKGEKIKKAEEKRLESIQRREIRRRMGFVRYYVCCLERQKYAAAMAPKSAADKLGKASKKKLRKEKKSKKDDLGDSKTAAEDRDKKKREKRGKKEQTGGPTAAKRQASRKDRSKDRKARARG